MNRAFKEWREVFPNAACVVSLIDRLVHGCEVVLIEGESYRLKEAKEQAERKTALRAAARGKGKKVSKKRRTRPASASGSPLQRPSRRPAHHVARALVPWSKRSRCSRSSTGCANRCGIATAGRSSRPASATPGPRTRQHKNRHRLRADTPF